MAFTRVKICGITSKADAAAAVAAGADAIGLVFYPLSPRRVAVASAAEIVSVLGPFVTAVGLFVDADSLEVQEILGQVPLQLLQFHGNETPAYCESFGLPYMKAIRMRPELDLAAEFDRFASASAILLDAYRPGVPGGTGATFDWSRVPRHSIRPLILAGGLTPENVRSAVEVTSVYGVDVSGGVELAPGKKDAAKIQTFIYNARHGSLR